MARAQYDTPSTPPRSSQALCYNWTALVVALVDVQASPTNVLSE